jgi:hypothetical protein
VGCDITAPIWQCLPSWIVILLGGRMAIPQDLYDAADIDGASVYPRVAHVTVPLLGNLYLGNTLISAIGPSGIVRRRCSSRTAILVQYLLALNDPPDRNGFRLKWFGHNACAIIIDDVNSWDGNTKIRRLELQQFHWLPSL